MNIDYDPDDYEIVVTQRTCPHHMVNPGSSYAACTCAGGYTQRRKPPEVIAKQRAAKAKAAAAKVTYKEYVITSSLGWWPESFIDLEDLARDLAYNREHYSEIEFLIKERDVTPWVDSDVKLPEFELPNYLKRGPLGAVTDEDEDTANLEELQRWIDEKENP